MDSLYLQKLVWIDRPEELETILIKGREINLNGYVKGKLHKLIDFLHRGMSPLHLAVQLYRKNCISVLLRAGADNMTLTVYGYSVFKESVSIADREFLREIYLKRSQQIKSMVHSRIFILSKVLNQEIPDFSIEFKWKFSSWTLFVSNIVHLIIVDYGKKEQM